MILQGFWTRDRAAGVTTPIILVAHAPDSDAAPDQSQPPSSPHPARRPETRSPSEHSLTDPKSHPYAPSPAVACPAAAPASLSSAPACARIRLSAFAGVPASRPAADSGVPASDPVNPAPHPDHARSGSPGTPNPRAPRPVTAQQS